MLDDKVREDLGKQYQQLLDAGNLLKNDELQRQYRLFAERFGPERLSGLDGRDLLYTMHALRADHRDSLVYWLEFKNDDEFRTRTFGSISGGSALKYGIYQRKEDGAWMTGSPQNQIELTTEAAIEVARRHREQLFQGVELVEELPNNATDEEYQRLQKAMNQEAPDISDTAWAHKYFHMLFPEKLDDFHVEHFQRFHLIKLVLKPPEDSGRYVSAGRFVQTASELEWPMNRLTAVLNHRNGRPYRYWRVLVQYPDEEELKNVWPAMRNGGFVSIGYHLLGDLSDIQHDQESKKEVQRRTKSSGYSKSGSWSNEIFSFVTRIREGDIILAFERSTILGIGRVTGPYKYDTSLPKSHHLRPVDWLDILDWELPQSEATGRVTRELRNTDNLIEVERRILGAPLVKPDGISPIGKAARLTGIPGRVQTILERKKQVILYGPPGTGKTYWAKISAQDLAAHRIFGQPYDQLSREQKNDIWVSNTTAGALVRVCTFHPAYGYEDFIEGYRPETTTGERLTFERRQGIFKSLCENASAHSEYNYYLIIDEINRGDIPRIFGELLTVMERDKRGQFILLPLSGETFSVPENVYIIGTMNTADRSIALLDTALRRRFGFIELMPDSAVLSGAVVGNTIPLGKWLNELNSSILIHIGRDARNLQIGHAYLLERGRPVTDMDRFVRILQDDIVPLLQEYCYEDYAALSSILGNTLVDREKQTIRHDLFRPERRDDLLAALGEQWPELIASADVVASEADAEELEQGEDYEVEEDLPE